MKSRKLGVRLAVGGFLLACLGPAPAFAGALSMTCHQLIQGAPDPDGNQFVLEGDVLSNRAFGTVTFLSSSKLSQLSPYVWSQHTVVGHTVRRAVYDKDKAGRTVGVLREVYDFDRQTVRSETGNRRDSCHHRGR